MGVHQTEEFLHSKGTINNTKQAVHRWNKIFTNDMSNKQLIPKIYKVFIQLTTKTKQNIQTTKKNQINQFFKNGQAKTGLAQ